MNNNRPIAFHHVSSVVSDLDRSVAFYSDLLGLEVRSRTLCEMGRLQIAGTGVDWPSAGDDWPTEPVAVVLLELGGVRVELAQPLDFETARAALAASGRTVSSSSHLALKVNDVRGLRRELEAAGVPFLTPLLVFPEEGHRPWIWCRCEDPDGHQVELVEEMPASYQLERMAERLREARAQRGLTLKEVAAQSSISVAHLSQVERGETVPSVPALLAISSALGVAPDYFFRVSPDDGLPASATVGGNGCAPPRDAGNVDWQWLTGPNAAVRLARVRFEAGASAHLPTPGLAAKTSCAVLEGTLLAEGAATHNLLTAGSSMAYDSAESYRFSNTGDAPAVGIWGLYEH